MSDEFAYPRTIGASFNYWWKHGREAGAQAEENLVKRGLDGSGIALVKEAPAEGIVARFRRLRLSGKDARRGINFLEISNQATREQDHAVVALHGYGNGLAFWFQNLKAMALPGTKLFVHDMLGFGRSGRPSFPCISSKANTPADLRKRVESAEGFFVDALEEWRESEKLEKMTLVGHSLGGYLSTAYALKHPSRVHKLILVSPVGVPESPYDMLQAEEETAGDFAAQEMADTREQAQAASQRPVAPTAWWTRAWDMGVSPFSLLRGMTVYAPSFMSRYGERRFASFPNDVQRDLFSYLYSISTDRGSGEHAVSHLLAPRAYARWPLIRRAPALDCPITCIYGDHDWMDSKGGHDLVKLLQSRPPSDQRRLQQKRSKVLINQYAGHWVQLEKCVNRIARSHARSPDGFNNLIRRELQDALDDL